MDVNNFNRLLNEFDFAKDMFEMIEEETGGKIERIVKAEEKGSYFYITFLFTDYRILEAKIQVAVSFGMPTIKIQGSYH